MDYSEKYVGSRDDFLKFMREALAKMGERSLTIEEQAIEIPEDVELEYKIKYDEDDEEYKVAIKVCWPKPEAQEVEEAK